MNEEYPAPADSTPGPVAVSVSGPDSSSGLPVVAEQGHQAVSSRGRYARVFGVAAVVAAAAGSYAYNSVSEEQRQQVVATIDDVDAKAPAKIFSTAYLKVLKEYYPADNDNGYDYKAARELMDDAALRTKGVDWQLPATIFIKSEDAKFSEDGKTVELEGQHYSFSEVRDHNGDLYILVTRPVKQDNMLAEDWTHMPKGMMIGGARLEPGMTEEVQREKAYADSRNNLEISQK